MRPTILLLMNNNYYDVVIAGAGPTGLMLANQLSRFGIKFLLIDKKSATTNESRALVVQARSMEIYEQMNLSDEVVKEGQISGGISLYKNGEKKASVFLNKMGADKSPFPYAMIFEQSKNEELLYKNLQLFNNDVQWNTELKTVEEKDEKYFITAMQNENAAINFSCKYLIACDGSKSVVRDFSKMEFSGGTYENVFYVADTHARGPNLAPNMISLFLARDPITMIFPMQGENRFRVLGILPKEYYHHDTIQFDELLTHVKSNMQMPVEFYDTQWYSTYKLHHKKVSHFNKGNIFFAGDAAHVHSPAGGQGMNTGLQDAYNLGWKLALVINKKSGEELLNSYHEERNPVAEKLLKTTDRFFTIMIRSTPLYGFLKLQIIPRVIPFILKFKKMQQLWFGEISQTQINYNSSTLSLGKAGKIVAGNRFPFFSVWQKNKNISVFQLIKENHTKPFLLISFNIENINQFQLNEDLFSVLLIDANDNNKSILKEKGFSNSFIIVLRPDNYIAYISEKINAAEMNNFMKGAYYFSANAIEKN